MLQFLACLLVAVIIELLRQRIENSEIIMRAFGDKVNKFSHQQRLGYFLEKEIKVGSGSDSSIVIRLKKKL